MIVVLPSGTSINNVEDPKISSGKNNLEHEIRDQKFETQLLEVVLFSCYKDLIADIEDIRNIEDEELRKIFQCEYKKRKKIGKYKLKPKEAEKIIERIISEFNKKKPDNLEEQKRNYEQRISQMLKLFGQPNDEGEYRLKPGEAEKIIEKIISESKKGRRYKNPKYIKELECNDYRRRIQMIQYFERSGNQGEKNMHKKVLTDQELKEILETDDVLTASLIMCELEDYELTLDLAKTLAMLGVFNVNNKKSIDDIPDFKGLSKDDKVYLCDMSKKINNKRKFRYNWHSLQDEIEAHFPQEETS